MANKVDPYGTPYSDWDPNPNSGLPPAGTQVTVYGTNGPAPGYVHGGRVVETKTGNNS